MCMLFLLFIICWLNLQAPATQHKRVEEKLFLLYNSTYLSNFILLSPLFTILFNVLPTKTQAKAPP